MRTERVYGLYMALMQSSQIGLTKPATEDQFSKLADQAVEAERVFTEKLAKFDEHERLELEARTGQLGAIEEAQKRLEAEREKLVQASTEARKAEEDAKQALWDLAKETNARAARPADVIPPTPVP